MCQCTYVSSQHTEQASQLRRAVAATSPAPLLHRRHTFRALGVCGTEGVTSEEHVFHARGPESVLVSVATLESCGCELDQKMAHVQAVVRQSHTA